MLKFIETMLGIQAPEFEEQRKKAHFFRTPNEFKCLAQYPPSHFILGLSDRYLLLHIAGAAMDSYMALDDKERAGKFLEILKSDFWQKEGFKGSPSEHVSRAVAFLIVHDGVNLEEENPFLEFCNNNGIEVDAGSIEREKNHFKPTENTT